MNLRFVLALSVLVTVCNGYKVLFLAPFNGKSHWIYLQSFVRALLDRGHEVTFLTSIPLTDLKGNSNYTEVLIDPPLDLSSMMPLDKFLESASGNFYLGTLFGLIQLKEFPRMINPYVYENKNVQKLIHSTGLHFDVVISEEFFGDGFLMFAHKFNAPIITICPFGATDFIDRQTGFIPISSFTSHWMLPFSDNMTFFQRWYNSLIVAYEWVIREYLYLPTEEEYTKKYFGHLGPLPTIEELHRKVSLVFVNSHRALARPRPQMPNVINIGGAQLKPGQQKPLPKDIQTFLDEAKDGVIYFSLGSVIKSAILPKNKIQSFLDSFKTIKQRVLWKFEDDSLTDIPSNVMIQKWMPQKEVLAHPNVILFISHGGAFGTSEALSCGVPMLLIPFFGDQHRNAQRIQRDGYGKFLTLGDITTEIFSKTINELVTNESYLTKARETSAIFNDNLVHPMDEAMFWIEHVSKFKGAQHLQSHAVHMTWFSYLLLDVLIVNVLVILTVIFIFYKVAKKLFCRRKVKHDSSKKKQ